MRRVDAWLAADLDAYMSCWTDDMVITLPSGVIEGATRYRKLVAAGFTGRRPRRSPCITSRSPTTASRWPTGRFKRGDVTTTR